VSLTWIKKKFVYLKGDFDLLCAFLRETFRVDASILFPSFAYLLRWRNRVPNSVAFESVLLIYSDQRVFVMPWLISCAPVPVTSGITAGGCFGPSRAHPASPSIGRGSFSLTTRRSRFTKTAHQVNLLFVAWRKKTCTDDRLDFPMQPEFVRSCGRAA
jgi:hypothetical protein